MNENLYICSIKTLAQNKLSQATTTKDMAVTAIMYPTTATPHPRKYCCTVARYRNIVMAVLLPV